MPRWIALLTLCAVTLGGGVEVAWADPAPVDTRESAPPVESAPSAEEVEEEKEADRTAGLTATSPIADRSARSGPEASPVRLEAPPVPPPR